MYTSSLDSVTIGTTEPFRLSFLIFNLPVIAKQKISGSEGKLGTLNNLEGELGAGLQVRADARIGRNSLPDGLDASTGGKGLFQTWCRSL